jgi:hypothetical protein
MHGSPAFAPAADEMTISSSSDSDSETEPEAGPTRPTRCTPPSADAGESRQSLSICALAVSAVTSVIARVLTCAAASLRSLAHLFSLAHFDGAPQTRGSRSWTPQRTGWLTHNGHRRATARILMVACCCSRSAAQIPARGPSKHRERVRAVPMLETRAPGTALQRERWRGGPRPREPPLQPL